MNAAAQPITNLESELLDHIAAIAVYANSPRLSCEQALSYILRESLSAIAKANHLANHGAASGAVAWDATWDATRTTPRSTTTKASS